MLWICNLAAYSGLGVVLMRLGYVFRVSGLGLEPRTAGVEFQSLHATVSGRGLSL